MALAWACMICLSNIIITTLTRWHTGRKSKFTIIITTLIGSVQFSLISRHGPCLSLHDMSFQHNYHNSHKMTYLEEVQGHHNYHNSDWFGSVLSHQQTWLLLELAWYVFPTWLLPPFFAVSHQIPEEKNVIIRRGQKFHLSACNYEWNLERTSNSSQSTRPVGRVL